MMPSLSSYPLYLSEKHSTMASFLPANQSSIIQEPDASPVVHGAVEWESVAVPKRDDDEIGNPAGGLMLTWENLWVTLRNRKAGNRAILQGLTGYARPGQLLAIMGPSGCGKTTLLDALSGRLDPHTRQAGDIRINGGKQPRAFQISSKAYVTQDEVLTWTLTVREAVHYSAQLQLPNCMPATEKRERAEAAITTMGLQDCADTRIGKWGSKGLSGGQKRRLSICMELLTRPKLLFLDEPTTGLDSAASSYVMTRIARLASCHGMTVVAAIHQPSNEVFHLFQHLCLLSSGKTVFFGPRHEVPQFFSANGFPCPSLQSASDHILKIINTDFVQDQEEDLNGEITSEEATQVLMRSYKSSHYQMQVQRQVAEICQGEGKVGGEIEMLSRAGFLSCCWILTRRSFLNMFREPCYFSIRLALNFGLSLALGSLYFRIGTDYDSIQARGLLANFISCFLTMMAVGSFPSFVDDLQVFRRERLNGHYQTGAYVIANTLSSTPYLLTISLIPGAICYYMAGLQLGWEHFMFFFLTVFASMMLVESLMMIVASIMPHFLMGLMMGTGVQGLMMLSSGFYRLANDLPKVFWRYPMHYISFHKYSFQGLLKNEYEGLTLSATREGESYVASGEEILKETWQIQLDYSKWVDLAILFGMVLLYRLLLLGVLHTNAKFKSSTRG